MKNYKLKATNYKLYFDTSDKSKIIVKLYKNSKLLSEKVEMRTYSSQVLLQAIEYICLKNNIVPNNISEIEINKGPGSYTGLKVGASVANMLSWYLKIPVNGKKNKILKPKFE